VVKVVHRQISEEITFFLDRACDGPAPLGGLLASRLVRLADAVEAQQASVRRDGALSELPWQAPQLVRAHNRVKRRHADVIRQLRWLAETLEDRCAGHAPTPVLGLLRRALDDLDAATDAETRLVLEAWWQETGAVD